MCLASPSKSSVPPVDPNAEIERKNQEAAENEKRLKNRDKALGQAIKQKRGGMGSVSLLTGSKGGAGYFDGTL
jgi:hypothetical protein